MNQDKKAVNLIDGQNYSMKKAAKTLNILFSHLQKSLGRKTVFFTKEMEQDLADTIKTMANVLVFYEFTPNQTKRAAFEYAEDLTPKHNFNTFSRLAGQI